MLTHSKRLGRGDAAAVRAAVAQYWRLRQAGSHALAVAARARVERIAARDPRV